MKPQQIALACAATVSIGLFAVPFGMVVSHSAHAQNDDDIGALNRQVVQLYRQGKYPEATKVAERALALAEKKFGKDHANVGQSLNNLALLYGSQGRYGEAEPLPSFIVICCQPA